MYELKSGKIEPACSADAQKNVFAGTSVKRVKHRGHWEECVPARRRCRECSRETRESGGQEQFRLWSCLEAGLPGRSDTLFCLAFRRAGKYDR
jgi:hypothetical protein